MRINKLLIGAALALSFVIPFTSEAAYTISQGGTGTSTAPSYGKFLVGGKNGEYEFAATSTIGGVNSVFGRTGSVVATAGDYTTAMVTEVTNLYFTAGRVLATALAGYTSTTGTISSSDTVLTAIEKLNGNLAAFFPVTIANGGTGTTTQVTNGINYYDGTKITSGTALTYDGTTASLNARTFIGDPTPGGVAGVANLVVRGDASNYIQILTDKTRLFGLTYFYDSTAGAFRIFSDYYGAGPEPKLVFGTYSNQTNQLVLNTNGTITLSSLTSGLVKSTSGVLSNAVSGTDYAPATSGTSLLYGNGSGGFLTASVGSGLTFVGGTLAATGGTSGTISTSSPLVAGLLVQSTGPSTIANIATSSLGLLTTNVAEGTNLYYTTARDTANFITNLAATTSVKSITTLPSLSLPYSQVTGGPSAVTPGGASSTVQYNANGVFAGNSALTYSGTDLTGTGMITGNAINATSVYRLAGGAFMDGNGANSTLRIYYGNGVRIVNPANGTAVFSFLNNGNAGIGSTTPNYPLSVQGASFLGGDLTATGTIAFTGLGTGFVQSVSGVLSSAALTSSQVTTALGFTPFGGTNPLPVANGGTGSTTLSGILIGNGTSALNSLIIGSGLSLSGTTLSATGGGGGSIGTSTPLANGQVDFSTGISSIGNDSNFFWDNTNKRLGIGSSSPFAKLAVSGDAYIGPDGIPAATRGTTLNTFTSDLNTNAVGDSFQTLGTLNTGGSFQMMQFNATDNGGNNVNTIQGINGLAIKSGTGSIGTLIAIQGSARLVTSTTGTTVNDFRAQTRIPAGTAASTTIGYEVSAPTSGGTVTNAYGFHTVAMKVSGVATGYGFASDGATDLNYFMGNTGVGTSTPGTLLSVQGVANFTTATSTIYSSGGLNFVGLTGCPIAINGTCLSSGGTYTAGTGLTLTGSSFSVNTSQNITQLSNLTVAGFVQTDASGNLSSAALTSGQVTSALGFTPYNATNPSNYIALTALSGTAPVTYNNTTGAIGITQASGSGNGYLSSTDWNVFNGKQSALTFTYPLVNTAGTVSTAFGTTTANSFSQLQQFNGNASTTQLSASGLIYAGNIINNGLTASTLTYANASKQEASAAVTAPLTFTSGTLAIGQASSGSNGYLTSTDWSVFNGKQAAGNYLTALTGDATASGPGSAALTLATVNSNVGTFTYPSVTVNAKGLITAISNGTAPTTYTAGTGLTLTTGAFSVNTSQSISQLSNLTTNGFVQTSGSNGTLTSAALTSGQVTTALGFTPYNATNPSAYIALTALSGSAPITYNNTTGAIGITQASGSTNGYLTSTDWNTFNGKQSALTGTTGQFPYFSGTNTVTATSSIFVAPNGYIGIGTTTPQKPLHVFGTTANGIALFERATTGSSFTSWSTFAVQADSNAAVGNLFGPSIDLYVGNNQSGAIGSQVGAVRALTDTGGTSAGDIQLMAVNAGSPVVALTGLWNGNIGIGTSTPINLLSVAGGAAIGSTYYGTAPTNGLIVQGNVGFGTQTPGYALQVAASAIGGSFHGGQFTITDTNAGLNLKNWTQSVEGGNFYLSTSSDAFATSTNSIFSIVPSTIANTVSMFQFTDWVLKQTSATAFTIMDGFGTIDAQFNTASTTGSIFTVAATTSPSIGSPFKLFDIDQYGSITASSTGPAPTIACSPSGGTLSANSNDQTGSFTTGSVSTSCTLTFGHAKTIAPNVFLQQSGNTVNVGVGTPTTGGFTATLSSGVTGDVISYFVVQQ